MSVGERKATGIVVVAGWVVDHERVHIHGKPTIVDAVLPFCEDHPWLGGLWSRDLIDGAEESVVFVAGPHSISVHVRVHRNRTDAVVNATKEFRLALVTGILEHCGVLDIGAKVRRVRVALVVHKILCVDVVDARFFKRQPARA